MSQTYPLARHGVFRTIQGEGIQSGMPQVFVRLAGCSVGCHRCDTDYRAVSEATADEIAGRCAALAVGERWCWLTGGEPTDHDLAPLVAALRSRGLMVALATAGHRRVEVEVDFLSVSPHTPDRWVQRWGTQVNLVPGLSGHPLVAFAPLLDDTRFDHRYVTPLAGDRSTVKECVAWVEQHPGWRLGCQAHNAWGVA